MDIVSRAGESLKQCEHELRGLGAESLQHGDYESARRITELAEALADRRARAGLGDPDPPSKGAADSGSSRSKSSAKPSQSASTRSSSRRAQKTSSTGYPRFTRRAEKLVKVGWSKKNKREYEHTTPWSAVLAFAEHLRSHTRPDRIFKVEDLMPVPDPDNETELPGYQVYLAMAWFREEGLIEKRGREGYVTHKDAMSRDTLSQRWAALPSRDN